MDIWKDLFRSCRMFQAGGTFNGSESAGIPFERRRRAWVSIRSRIREPNRRRCRKEEKEKMILWIQGKERILSTSVFFPSLFHSFFSFPESCCIFPCQVKLCKLWKMVIALWTKETRDERMWDWMREERRRKSYEGAEMRSQNCNFGPRMNLHSL